jgi:hypothetical protein
MEGGHEHEVEAAEEQQLNRGFLMYLAEVSEILAEDLEKLFYNGFDNPESIELLTLEDLQ